MKKKAFTLTELLVAVVIIGVLSAIVLPKFTKVLETRKTGEAEEMLAAVRNEQEARCMLDKPYVTQEQQSQRHLLASMPKNTGTNFSYTLTNTGIEAQRTEGDYTLSIPSYTDGRICCSGSGCDKLDKDYPKCTDLQAKSDYVQTNLECVADMECSNANAHEEGATTTKTVGPCTITYKWTFSDYPSCTWNQKEVDKACTPGVKPDECKEGYRGEEQDCVSGGQNPNAQRGIWGDDCSCQCPEGTSFKEGEGCVPQQQCTQEQEAQRQNCTEGAHGLAGDHTKGIRVEAGTWNDETCSCECPQNYFWVNNLGCVTSWCHTDPQAYANDKAHCNDQSWKSQEHCGSATGVSFWSEITCRCMCSGSWKNSYGFAGSYPGDAVCCHARDDASDGRGGYEGDSFDDWDFDDPAVGFSSWEYWGDEGHGQDDGAYEFEGDMF